MKYRIGSEKPPPEPEVKLSLQRDGKAINVVADDWYVLTFEEDGTITMHGAVPSTLGFKTTNRGHVVVSKERP